MSSSTAEVLSAAVLTASDSSAWGERADVSGHAVAEILKKRGFSVIASQIVPDDQAAIQGIAERDVTPEATRAVCTRLIEGVAERMRFEGSKKTPLAALSRGICGVRGKSVILNLPGSPRGATESLEAVIDLMPHALELLAGNTKHTG